MLAHLEAKAGSDLLQFESTIVTGFRDCLQGAADGINVRTFLLRKNRSKLVDIQGAAAGHDGRFQNQGKFGFFNH